MGCGTSRSPTRIGVITDDNDSLYEEFFPSMATDWAMRESARDVASSSLCNSPSPPPYTPLPLSGHVTLLVGSSSPTKRQNSVQTSVRGDRESEVEEERLSILSSSPRDDSTSQRELSLTSTDMLSQLATEPVVIPVAPLEDQHRDESLSLSLPTDHLIPLLSSSLPPSHRPPSPFPRSRSLSFQLPPLRTIQPSNDPLSPPLHLPPLRELPPLQHSTTDTSQLKRRRRRERSKSCQEHTSILLSSSQEQNIPLVQ